MNAAAGAHLMSHRGSPVEIAVMVHGHVTQQAPLFPVKGTPLSTHVVAVVYWLARQEIVVVTVMTALFPVALTTSLSTVTAPLR